MVFPNQKGWENQKEEDQEQVKDLEGTASGESKNQRISANRIPFFYGIWDFGVNVRSNSEPNTPPEKKKNISSFVSAENGKSSKVNRPKKSNFVQISTKDSQNKPHFFKMISAFEQTHRKCVPIVFFFCFELCFRRNRAKDANWKTPFSQKPISVKIAHFPNR